MGGLMRVSAHRIKRHFEVTQGLEEIKFVNLNLSQLSLVILTSRFEKKLEGYFGTDFIILNHGQMTRTASELVLQTSAPYQRAFDLLCMRRWIFSGIGYRNLELSCNEVESLPLGHCGSPVR
ncbi:hypothetical protein AVEN_83793-1 [Araneus ventricosus]|uniref:Uncharacterized protein n=1 Tax=Araneus ventricosus TaxID=182803 RepID=A0A4Y2CQG7_ARAVE|nr:hypothetical protein AVEN_83793-1 [Araneus ventricosus]